jgi:hypothetical protein
VIILEKMILSIPFFRVDKKTIFDKVVSETGRGFSLPGYDPKKKGGNVWESIGESF